MKVPFEWLKEIISIKLSAKQIAEKLTMGGLETVVEEGSVLEVDILPNRADAWSIRGIAFDVAALTNSKVKSQKSKIMILSNKNIKDVASVEVKDKKACPRYMARVIEAVKVGPSPDWMVRRLEQAGVRSINNIVDITNYLLLELGQPMHAFDYDQITDRKIIVRRAEDGEKIKTLDGIERKLTARNLVIADPLRPIALAGVMGGSNSEVTINTGTVLLESASFDPITINITSKEQKIRTESSVRFEHGVAWDVVETALDRAAEMIAELAGGIVLKGKINVKAMSCKQKTVTLREKRIEEVLGVKVSGAKIKKILMSLGFGVKNVSKGFKVTIPFSRQRDVEREIDLIEEVARINGYDKIPVRFPNTSFEEKTVNHEDLFMDLVRDVLVGAGLNEVTTMGMLSSAEINKAGLDGSAAIRIANPMSEDQSVMRTSMLPNMLAVLKHNINHMTKDVMVFEISRTFQASGSKLPNERSVAAGIISGSPMLSRLDKVQADYYFLKGTIENLLEACGIREFDLVRGEKKSFYPGKSALIKTDRGAVLGEFGEISPLITNAYDIKVPVFYFEMDLAALYKEAGQAKKYAQLAKFPSVYRDISVKVPSKVLNQQIIKQIKNLGKPLVEKVELFDKYQDNLAYRVAYRDPKRTLTDDEVNRKHKKISEGLSQKLGVTIR